MAGCGVSAMEAVVSEEGASVAVELAKVAVAALVMLAEVTSVAGAAVVVTGMGRTEATQAASMGAVVVAVVQMGVASRAVVLAATDLTVVALVVLVVRLVVERGREFCCICQTRRIGSTRLRHWHCSRGLPMDRCCGLSSPGHRSNMA